MTRLLTDCWNGLTELVPIQPSRSVSRAVHDTFLVNYSIRMMYQQWMKRRRHPEFDRLGTVTHRFDQVELCLHPWQKIGDMIRGQDLYRYLEKGNILPTCLAFRDLKAIQGCGISTFRAYFGEHFIYAWKEVVEGRDGMLYVPYMMERRGKVVLCWDPLSSDLGSRNIVARFKEMPAQD